MFGKASIVGKGRYYTFTIGVAFANGRDYARYARSSNGIQTSHFAIHSFLGTSGGYVVVRNASLGGGVVSRFKYIECFSCLRRYVLSGEVDGSN